MTQPKGGSLQNPRATTQTTQRRTALGVTQRLLNKSEREISVYGVDRTKRQLNAAFAVLPTY